MITDALRKNLTVKEHDELQNLGKLGSASIQKCRKLTKCFFTKQVGNDESNLIPKHWLLYTPKDKSLNCFYCFLFAQKKIVVEAALQRKEDFGNERRVKRYLKMRQVSLLEILLLHDEGQKYATL